MSLSKWLPRPWRSRPQTGPGGRKSRRQFLGAAARLAGYAALVGGLHGAVPAKELRNLRKKPDRAWLNARGICVLPLAKDRLPASAPALTASLLGGWKDVFTFPDADRVVTLSGGRYPAVDSLRVDLSGAVANPDHKSAKIPEPVFTTKRLTANHFTMLAEPLVSGKAKINLKVTGVGARFDLQHDKDGKPILMLADAKEGTLHFDLTQSDLQKLMLAQAKALGASKAVAVRSLDLKLDSLGPRSLKASLHVSTLVGFIPAGIKFTARVDIDDAMNAKISNLTCDGDELIGPLIVGLIRPSLAKYDGQTKPLVAFPSGDLELRDLQIDVGERVALTARFGR